MVILIIFVDQLALFFSTFHAPLPPNKIPTESFFWSSYPKWNLSESIPILSNLQPSSIHGHYL